MMKDKKIKDECVKCDEEKGLCGPVDCDKLIENEDEE